MHLLRFDGSAKSKGSRVLTKFLCENIREKLKWKGLSLSAPKQKRCALWLFYHQMTNSSLCAGRGRRCISEHRGPTTTSHTCLSDEHDATQSWLHSSGTDQLLACIPVLISLAYLYHSTFYPSTKNKKFSGWTFTSITHVSYSQLHLLYQERYLHSTST